MMIESKALKLADELKQKQLNQDKVELKQNTQAFMRSKKMMTNR